MATNHVDLSETRGPAMVGAIVSTYCIAIIAVTLRVVARRVGKVSLWIDEYLIFAGMVRNLSNLAKPRSYVNVHTELRRSTLQW